MCWCKTDTRGVQQSDACAVPEEDLFISRNVVSMRFQENEPVIEHLKKH